MKKYFILLFTLLFSGNLHLFSQYDNDFYNINKIREIRITFKEKNWKHILDSLFQKGNGDGRLIGNISIDGQVFHQAGIRYKGFSSWNINEIKTPFNIELDYLIHDRNYQGYTSLRLSNVIHDPSFVREVLSYEIARKYMPASYANFANLYINDTLIGLYTNVEAVNKKFLSKHFTSKDNSFFKGSPAKLEYPFGENANLAYSHGTDTIGYMPYYELESYWGWGDLLNLIYILNEKPDSIDKILNTDRALWMHAFNYVLLNLDSYIGYCQNFYLYLDDNGRFNTIPWDLNMSFGSFRNSDGISLNLSIPKIKQLNPLEYLNSASFTPRPLLKNLLQNPTYRKIFLAHMRTIVDENFKNNEYFIKGQEIQNTIVNAVKNDTNKFYPDSNFIRNLSVDAGTTADQYPGIKSLMEARMAYLDTFPGFRGEPTISEINHIPDIPQNGKELWITAKVKDAKNVVLAYKFSSIDIFHKTTMFDDGNHQDGVAGDSIYGAKLIPGRYVIQYYIYAENDSAAELSPARAEYEFYTIQTDILPGELTINEFMPPKNLSSGESDVQWIELFNNRTEKIKLKGFFLSDDSNNLTKWAFPDTLIEAKKYLIIRTDGSQSQTGLHANFKLSGTGGQIMISKADHQIIDSVIYGQSLSSMSIGRYPNGIGSFTNMLPSFSKYNFIGITAEPGFRIYPNPVKDKLYVEIENNLKPSFIEIYNSTGQTLITGQMDTIKELTTMLNKEIDISALCKGAYYLKIICNDKIMIGKFLIY